MFGFEARDKSGPMDLDPVDQSDRMAAFAIPHPEEGPSRKRMHADINTPQRPSHGGAGPSRHLHFGTNTPFIFHTANLPKPPTSTYKPYDPSEWVGADFSMGRSTPVSPAPVRQHHSVGAMEDDVEMRWGDSPARPEAGLPRPPETSAAAKEGTSNPERKVEERPMAQGAVSRVRKKRQKEWRRRRDSVSTNGEADERVAAARPAGPTKTEHTYHFNVPTPSLRHSEIPALLLGYLQFFVNASVVVFVLYFAVQFVLTVRNDVKDRMKEYSVEALQEIAECTKLYLTNRCDPALRVPAMAWEACMQRDPTIVGRTNVVAETFAGVINSFVDPISWKTMGFTLVTLSFLIILTNSALWNLRARASPSVAEAGTHVYPGHHALMQPGWPSHLQSHQAQLHPPSTQSGAGPVPGAIGWQDEKKGKSWW